MLQYGNFGWQTNPDSRQFLLRSAEVLYFHDNVLLQPHKAFLIRQMSPLSLASATKTVASKLNVPTPPTYVLKKCTSLLNSPFAMKEWHQFIGFAWFTKATGCRQVCIVNEIFKNQVYNQPFPKIQRWAISSPPLQHTGIHPEIRPSPIALGSGYLLHVWDCARSHLFMTWNPPTMAVSFVHHQERDCCFSDVHIGDLPLPW